MTTMIDGPMTCEEMRARIEDLERRVLVLARERDEAIDARLDAERAMAQARVSLEALEAELDHERKPPEEWPAEDPLETDVERGETDPVRPAVPPCFGSMR